MPGAKTCGDLKGQAKKDCLAYKGKYHPVGKKHKKTDMKSSEFRDGRSKYKEGV